MKKRILSAVVAAGLAISGVANAAEYQIDKAGAHAFINFKIKHLGYSWLTGRFNDFDGDFSYDKANPNASKINVVISTASIDSNHAERDKHLKGKDFLNVKKFPKATFESTKYEQVSETEGKLTGILELHGVKRTITFPVEKIGEGKDPWGGYRVGFSGETSLKLKDFGIDYNLGPASTHVTLELHIEGIKK
ncbi:YceI family protein [Pseudoalteromonas luteoviolacea]|uniref:Lipid/polyisoprenoid-binding YceI-like domain-containing protein n=1 Tax=Pseudoalteromonas luteoviolacea NCIMB 1942 TaxID=1365253 RepID=A0A167F298_9GAMM|nr:YceI family protein [Pseudoalteromonas luteoviolacea]KZN51549.1 hypothetical protein N482_25165 [Pseudoalteromonas luteoviolacea NCIMB 1942]KZW98251.1 hypothetical protein JL49_24455 [Pseudoalteromonas luteoviolacea]